MPTSISDPIAETYIPGCKNRVQRETVFPDDSVLKGMTGVVLFEKVLINLVYWN